MLLLSNMDKKKGLILGGIGLFALILILLGIGVISSAASDYEDEDYERQPTIIINNIYSADEQKSSYQPIQPTSSAQRDTGNTYYSNTYYSTSYASRYPRHYSTSSYYPYYNYYPSYYSHQDPFYYGPGVRYRNYIWD